MAEKSRFKVANTSDPDSFKPGAPTNFVGVLESIYAYPHVGKESKDNRHWGFIGYKIIPHPDSGYDPFTKKILAFYLNSAVPSKDGESPAGGNDDAYRMLSNGKANLEEKYGPCVDEQGHVKPDHPNVGEYILGTLIEDGAGHQLFDSFRDCDEKGAFLDHTLTSMNQKYAGLECHWDLVQPRPRKGGARDNKKDGKESDDRLVLVPTKILSKGNKVSGAIAGTSKTSSASAGTNGSGDGTFTISPELQALIEKELIEVLKTSETKTMSLQDLMLETGRSLRKKKLIEKSQLATVHHWIGDRQEPGADGLPGLPINLTDLDEADWNKELYKGLGGLELV